MEKTLSIFLRTLFLIRRRMTRLAAQEETIQKTRGTEGLMPLMRKTPKNLTHRYDPLAKVRELLPDNMKSGRNSRKSHRMLKRISAESSAGLTWFWPKPKIVPAHETAML
jgi:hypothetical protein